MFYTEDGADGLHDPVNDGPSTPAGNTDQDEDLVPDFAERVYNCLVTAQKRYKDHYNLSDPTAQSLFHWMRMDYVDPSSGNNNEVTGGFYPLVLRNETGSDGKANTWSIADLLNLGMITTPTTPPGATWITLDQEAATFRGDAPWLYAATENTLYHEMFHVYQGIYKAKTDVGGFADQWLYEGTAVYAADQALLPPCETDKLNPVRIVPRPSSPPQCRIPFIRERDSEARLGLANAIFTQPWLGLRRDDYGFGGKNISYSSVLFWYYAQAHLRDVTGATEKEDKDDFLGALLHLRGGDDNAVYEWVAASQFGSFENMYHQFMIDNYLQEVSYPGFDNPYYDSWNKWEDATHWYIDKDVNVTIRSDEIIPLALNAQDTLPGDNGDSNRVIEYLGTRYYAIDPDPSTPTTATLQVRFELYNSFSKDSNDPIYNVTLLDVEVDAAGQPEVLKAAIKIKDVSNNTFRVSNFGGPNRRAVLAVSRIKEGDGGFNILAQLGDGKEIMATTAPNPFSPNDDGRKDDTAITYFLPDFPSSAPSSNTYDVDVDLIQGVSERPVARLTQVMSQTHVYT